MLIVASNDTYVYENPLWDWVNLGFRGGLDRGIYSRGSHFENCHGYLCCGMSGINHVCAIRIRAIYQ